MKMNLKIFEIMWKKHRKLEKNIPMCVFENYKLFFYHSPHIFQDFWEFYMDITIFIVIKTILFLSAYVPNIYICVQTLLYYIWMTFMGFHGIILNYMHFV